MARYPDKRVASGPDFQLRAVSSIIEIVQYDPEIAPCAAEWLSLTRRQRKALILAHLRKDDHGIPATGHLAATLEAVETHIAMGFPGVREAMLYRTRQGQPRWRGLMGLLVAFAFTLERALDGENPRNTYRRYLRELNGLMESWDEAEIPLDPT